MSHFCHVSLSPLRRDPADTSEMISQILYGETVEILHQEENFSHVRMLFDGYEGWCDTKHLLPHPHNTPSTRYTLCQPYLHTHLSETQRILSLGAEVPFPTPRFQNNPRESIPHLATQFLGAPYLWGGRSIFGVDCSGLCQIIFKAHGIHLLRDAHQQATQGQPLDFLGEALPGDLAFFENNNGHIHHVGIILSPEEIIHASGHVRRDPLDYSGIYNQETGRHTHRLLQIRRYF